MRRSIISVAAAVLVFGAVVAALFLPRVLVTNGSEVAHGLALPPGPPNTSVHAAPLPAPPRPHPQPSSGKSSGTASGGGGGSASAAPPIFVPAPSSSVSVSALGATPSSSGG